MTSVHSTEPTIQRLALNGKRIAYVSEGSGIAVVALHGYPGSSRDFRWLAACMSASFHVLSIDMPGFGASEAMDESPSYDNDARTLIAVLEALQIERPVLLTHSMGGAVAACALAQVPRLASAVVLLAPPGLEPHRQYRRIPCKVLSKAACARVGSSLVCTSGETCRQARRIS